MEVSQTVVMIFDTFDTFWYIFDDIWMSFMILDDFDDLVLYVMYDSVFILIDCPFVPDSFVPLHGKKHGKP